MTLTEITSQPVCHRLSAAQLRDVRISSPHGVRESKVDVYHRIFLTLAGPDTLSPLASVLAGNSNLMLDGGDPKLGQWYALPEEEGSVQFSFEFPIGSNSRATREGDIEKVRKEMLTQFGMLQARSPQCFELLVLAEHSWRKVREMNGKFSKALSRRKPRGYWWS